MLRVKQLEGSLRCNVILKNICSLLKVFSVFGKKLNANLGVRCYLHIFLQLLEGVRCYLEIIEAIISFLGVIEFF